MAKNISSATSYSDFWKFYKDLYLKKDVACYYSLWNGYLFPQLYFDDGITEEKLNERLLAIENIMKWRSDAPTNGTSVDGTFPEAEIAVYDISDRKLSKRAALNYIVKAICNSVNPLDIYMWNPLGISASVKNDGYKWYSGQKVIVYQITKKCFSRDLLDLIQQHTVNGYEISDPLLAVKKVIIVVDDWPDKWFFLRFNLGIDADDYMLLFDDAWKGLKHEWTTKDNELMLNTTREEILEEKFMNGTGNGNGNLLREKFDTFFLDQSYIAAIPTNDECAAREDDLFDIQVSLDNSKGLNLKEFYEKKPRKTRRKDCGLWKKIRASSKKKDTRVWLIDRKGTRSAFF